MRSNEEPGPAKPTVDIAICVPIRLLTKGQEFEARRLFRSISEQTVRPSEIIVSVFYGAEAIRRIESDFPLDLTITSAGPYSTLGENTISAVQPASASFIKLMGHDDYFHGPDSLQRLFEFVAARPGSWAVCDFFNEKSTQEVLTDFEELRPSLGLTLGPPAAAIYPNLVELRYKITDTGLNHFVDHDMHQRLMEVCGTPFYLRGPAIVVGQGEYRVSTQPKLRTLLREVFIFLYGRMKRFASLPRRDVRVVRFGYRDEIVHADCFRPVIHSLKSCLIALKHLRLGGRAGPRLDYWVFENSGGT